MNRSMKNMFRALSTGLAVVLLFLQGCSTSSRIRPSAKEISERSKAAGFLASLVEDQSGFISGNSKTEEA